MELTGLGSGTLLALAAALWLVYLVPSWLRRSEYLATERNALRLQQTIRVLAETAEVPIAIRAETTAKSIAAHQRSLREQQQLTDAVVRAQTAAATRAHARALAEARPTLAAVVTSQTLIAKRLRRTRLATAVVFLGSSVTVIVQAILMLTTGVAPAAPAVLAFAGVGAVSSFLMIGRLSRIHRSRNRVVAAPVLAQQRRTMSAPSAVQVERAAWTPVPLPKPLYLSRPTAEREVFDHESAMAHLRAAAAQSDAALRRAHSAPEVSLFSRPASPAATPDVVAPSRFASMGIVDPREISAPDLDDVLRRRRAAG
ncbi:MAG: hypothetical protein ACOH1J_02035 [Microbacteriaceae bacterium]